MTKQSAKSQSVPASVPLEEVVRDLHEDMVKAINKTKGFIYLNVALMHHLNDTGEAPPNESETGGIELLGWDVAERLEEINEKLWDAAIAEKGGAE